MHGGSGGDSLAWGCVCLGRKDGILPACMVVVSIVQVLAIVPS